MIPVWERLKSVRGGGRDGWVFFSWGVGRPTVGRPTVGRPTVGPPTVGPPTVGPPTVGRSTTDKGGNYLAFSLNIFIKAKITGYKRKCGPRTPDPGPRNPDPGRHLDLRPPGLSIWGRDYKRERTCPGQLKGYSSRKKKNN